MWFKTDSQYVFLFIYAKPNAKKTQFLGIKDGLMHISIHAKAQDGKANSELISFIAQAFKTPKSSVILMRGEHSRHKQLRLPCTESITCFLEQMIDANGSKYSGE